MTRLTPQTAREALFEIRRVAAGVHVDMDVIRLAEVVDRTAIEGLARTESVNFELIDTVADRLAEAHFVLGMVKEHLYGRLPDGDREIEGHIDRALTLPPDLEALVERRKHG